ncbi:MAG: hypothetical protein HYS17_06795 [Micavibrio aeruginosavorus]|uniref:Uncharacterized protein n=1 Tax=Micavibrio aeruginosavorus TaxID=349221 RepID=A0A7T5UFX4_9BACT|nr:MAG: hypothetical protein HYS17_06795 [Micavibrio aeruginosavorus]
MARTWTSAQRAAAAERIHASKPWEKSTGPQTWSGKNIVKMNALKHGQRSAAVLAERRAAVQYLRRQKEFLKQVRLLLRLQRQIKKTSKPANKLITGKDLLTPAIRLILPLPFPLGRESIQQTGQYNEWPPAATG